MEHEHKDHKDEEKSDDDKATILLIEDDRPLQELYLDAFTRAGFIVLQAFDGKEGLELMEKHPEIKVILVDIMLPKISGYDVIAKIRAGALNRDIPIIVVSALSDQDSREKGLEVGANEYIAKGEKLPKEIIEEVRRYAQAPPALPQAA